MHIRMRPLVALAALGALVLLTVTGCEPREGDTCNNKGEFYTHNDSHGHRVSLSCQPSGIDSNGKQTLRWVKA